MTPSAKNTRTLLILVVLLALALRLPNLSQTVWFDEACMARQRLGTFGQMFTTLYVDNHPPLYVLFMYAWVQLFGDGEVAMRIPSLVVGLASIPLTYAIGVRLFGGHAGGGEGEREHLERRMGQRIGLVAALLMCLSPVLIWYSIEARLYAHILFLALLAVWLFHRVLDGGTRRDMLALVATVVAMPFVHYYLTVFLVVFAGLGLLATRLGSERRTGLRVLFWSSLATALILGFAVVKFAMAEFNTSLGYMADLDLPETYRLFFQWAWTGNATAGGPSPSGGPSVAAWSAGWIFWVALQVAGIVLFLRGLAHLRRVARERPEAWCVLAYLLCLPLFLLLLPLVGLHGTYISRSILPFVPFLFLVVAAGWASLATARLRKLVGGLVVGALVVNLAAFFGRPDDWTVYKPHQDWRTAAAYFTAELEAGPDGAGDAAGRPIFTTMPNQRSLSYYDPRIQTRTNLESTMGKVDSAKRIFVDKLGEGLGGWLAARATAMAEDVEATRIALLEGTELLVHPLRGATPDVIEAQLEGTDGTFYVLHNLWNPPGDRFIGPLVASDELELLERLDLRGLVIYKLRRRP